MKYTKKHREYFHSHILCSFLFIFVHPFIFYNTDHSVFYRHSISARCIYLVVYVDDIVLTSSDHYDISQVNIFYHHF